MGFQQQSVEIEVLKVQSCREELFGVGFRVEPAYVRILGNHVSWQEFMLLRACGLRAVSTKDYIPPYSCTSYMLNPLF